MANAALVASPLAAGTLLPRDALDRSVPELPLGSAPLRNVLRRLQRGEPLIVTAIGMSNTFGSEAYAPQDSSQRLTIASNRLRARIPLCRIYAAGLEPVTYDSIQPATRVHTPLPPVLWRSGLWSPC